MGTSYMEGGGVGMEGGCIRRFPRVGRGMRDEFNILSEPGNQGAVVDWKCILVREDQVINGRSSHQW